MNIPDSSIFSPNYDVDSYLRRNLNPRKDFGLSTPKNSSGIDTRLSFNPNFSNGCEKFGSKVNKYDTCVNKKDDVDIPIPVLRHSPKVLVESNDYGNDKISDAMRVVEDKWKVPVVQKNILKSYPNNEGKSVNILTQLGSIRRQLQLEQLKLDKMLKDGAV